jgi:hypothetical protein
MIRVIIENVLLFLAPALIYFAYVWLMRREDTEGRQQALFDDAPVLWLLLAGAVLVLVTLVAFGSFGGGKPGDAYVPPVVKDGRIVPGHLEPQKKQ